MILYRVELDWATFGIETVNSVITNAPPIAKWMIGKKLSKIEYWVRTKGGKIVENNVERI